VAARHEVPTSRVLLCNMVVTELMTWVAWGGSWVTTLVSECGRRGLYGDRGHTNLGKNRAGIPNTRIMARKPIDSESPSIMASLRSRFRSDRSAEPDYEDRVRRYFHDYVDRGKPPGYIYITRYPGKSVGAFIALFRLPCLHVAPSAVGINGPHIRGLLSQRSASLLSPRSMLERLIGFATTGLSLPTEAGQYSLGASKQTLRRKVRRAQKLGVRWAEVSDPQERQELLKLAEDYERTHPDETYRNPNPDISDLLRFQLWLAAYSAEGHPLLLSVTPVDGELATLAYFRTLGAGEEQSNARYLMTEILVEHLVGCGVRILLDGGSLAMPNGRRHFQRMLGFRIVRVRVTRPGRGTLGGTVEFAGRAGQHARCKTSALTNAPHP
jgi:hypothetical protein